MEKGKGKGGGDLKRHEYLVSERVVFEKGL